MNPDPRPPGCPDHGTRVAGCAGCRPLANWRSRRADRARREGRHQPNVDVAIVAAHIEHLMARGLTVADIVERSGTSKSTVLSAAGRHSLTVHAYNAAAILGVCVPEQDLLPRNVRTKTPAAPTRRRLRAMIRDGHSTARIGEQIGSGREWVVNLVSSLRVNFEVATEQDIAALYRRWSGTLGGCSRSSAWARAKGWLGSACWTEETITDLTYDPYAADPNSYRARRRLRALAYAGFGEHHLAAETGEDPTSLRRWTRTDSGPIPHYVLPLIDPIYQRLARYVGPCQATSEYARAHKWSSAVAWQEFDIDEAFGHARRLVPARPATAADPAVMHAAAVGAVPAVELTVPERTTVVHHLHAGGRTPEQIGTLMRWAPTSSQAAAAVADTLSVPVDPAHRAALQASIAALSAPSRNRPVLGLPAAA